MIALDALSATWFIPDSEKDNDAPAEFKLRGLSGIEAMDLIPAIKIDENNNVTLGTEAIRVLLTFGLRDWKNIFDSEGKEISYNPNSLSRLPLFVCKDLALEVFSRTQITADDKKKS